MFALVLPVWNLRCPGVLAFFKVDFMAPVTPLLQCEPKPIMLTKMTARIFMDQGTLELFVLALSSTEPDTGVSSLRASFTEMTPEGVFVSSVMALVTSVWVVVDFGGSRSRSSNTQT